MRFNIVEGEYNDVDYESFKTDYMDRNVSKSTILEKYGLSHPRYLRFGERVFRDTGFKRKKGVVCGEHINKGSMFIRKTRGGRFRIDKGLDGRKLYCGTYESFSLAVKVRDYLVEHDWSDSAIEYCISGGLS